MSKGENTQSTEEKASESKEAGKEKKSNKFSLKNLKLRAENAWDALRKKGSPWEKVKGVFGALFGEIKAVETEEEKKKKETTTQAGAVLKNLNSENAVEALVPALSVTDEKGVVQKPPEVVKDFVSVTYDTAKLFDDERTDSGDAKSGETMGILTTIADKVDEKKNPEKKTLNDEEARVFLGYGAKLAVELKKKYPDKADFKEALDAFEESTEKAPVGFHTLKTDTFKGLFSDADMKDVLDPILSRLGPIQQIKLGTSAMSGKLAKDLKTGNIPEILTECSAKIFPNTDKDGRDRALKTIGQILSQKELGASFPTNQQITDLVFDISENDFLELSNILA